MEYVKEVRSLIGTRPFIIVGSTVIVQDKQNRVLLQLRSDTNEWGLPGGAMEPGESFVETARRELFEETGLTADYFEHIETLSGENFYFKYPNGDEVYNVIAVFIVTQCNGKLKMVDGESLSLQYFPMQDLPMKLDERAKQILDRVGVNR
ncbi:NUDIX hydrolase [Halobacillus mangrovi]|uniref:ADP-ribose pyrophosphatase n=1 Tax=Halobacillus mangrovi TaxID=402384 RepID=A0A1W6A0N4_9BACI|nr:NUDIX hydrolase [Halobacillus mangrovi]ARI79051.1 ADP-ribose pyrophosphatase [Halobacillus mangrovi]